MNKEELKTRTKKFAIGVINSSNQQQKAVPLGLYQTNFYEAVARLVQTIVPTVKANQLPVS